MYLSAAEIRHHYPANLKCEDVAKLLDTSASTVRDLIIRGDFPFGISYKGYGENGKWGFFIPTERFLAWLEGVDMRNGNTKRTSEV
jgi:hypothetical protein